MYGQWSRAHILQAGAVLVLVEVVVLPKAQQVVEVVEQAAGIFLCVFLLPQGVQVKRELASPPGQHQNHQAGVKTTHILLGKQPEKQRRKTQE